MSDFSDRPTDSARASQTPETNAPPLPRIQPQSPPVPEWSGYGQSRFDEPAQPTHYIAPAYDPSGGPSTGPVTGPGGASSFDGPAGSPSYGSSAAAVAAASPAAAPAPAPSSTGSSSGGYDDQGPTGAGVAGYLSLIGLTGACVGLFALPLLKSGRTEYVYANFRQVAALDRTSVRGSQTLDSPLGGSLATFWWRYGALIAVSAVALLIAVMITARATRRIGGALLFLGAGAATAVAVLAGTQTNDYSRAVFDFRYQKVEWRHWQVGAWVALAGFALAALAGLVSLVSGIGSDDD